MMRKALKRVRVAASWIIFLLAIAVLSVGSWTATRVPPIGVGPTPAGPFVVRGRPFIVKVERKSSDDTWELRCSTPIGKPTPMPPGRRLDWASISNVVTMFKLSGKALHLYRPLVEVTEETGVGGSFFPGPQSLLRVRVVSIHIVTIAISGFVLLLASILLSFSRGSVSWSVFTILTALIAKLMPVTPKRGFPVEVDEAAGG